MSEVKFIKISDRVWRLNCSFNWLDDITTVQNELKKKYPRSSNKIKTSGTFGLHVYIRFKSNVDEAEFILRESL